MPQNDIVWAHERDSRSVRQFVLNRKRLVPDARAPVRYHAVEGVGATEELVDERGLRCFVNFCRRADLFDTATGHDCDTVSKRQRFFLIVRHEHGREARRIVQLAQPSPEIDAYFCVESSEGLVEKKQFRFRRKRAREGHALALAAGQLLGKT